MEGPFHACGYVASEKERERERERLVERNRAYLKQRSETGPHTNPAKLELTPDTTVQDLFSQLFIAAIASDDSIRFLSRFDKSATNIRESAIWASIGQTPWAYPYSSFYHVDNEFPYQALATAAKLNEYTLTDRGTWYGAEPWVRDDMRVFVRFSRFFFLYGGERGDKLSLLR